VALSADGTLLASGGQDGTIRIWDPVSQQCLRILQMNSGTVYCVALSGDGRLLASGGLDGTIRLCDPDNGQLVVALEANIGVVRGGLSGDGRLLAAGGQDGTVRLSETGTSLHIFLPDRLYRRLDITSLSGRH
jgi:WD40 repeat protein